MLALLFSQSYIFTLIFFFIFVWTSVCSECKNEDAQLLRICTSPVFSETVYKMKTFFLFINFYWKNKVFVEQWKFHISLKQNWFFGELQLLLRTRKPVFSCAGFCTPGICPESGRKQLVRQGCKSAAGLGIVNLDYFSLLIILYKYTHTYIYDLFFFFKTHIAYCVVLTISVGWMDMY